jgi:1,4-alpha-glucan branching enzyme
VTSLIQEQDRWWFNEGAHARLHEVLGAQPLTDWPSPGRRFAVWAPSARQVHVIGDFNGWQAGIHPLSAQESSGIWANEVPEAHVGNRYKFRIETADGHWVERADPMAAASELPPDTASVVTDLTYRWNDDDWMARRQAHQAHDRPLSVYELHPGSWRHAEAHRSLYWTEMADPLADHVCELGFTHVELLPVMEHPFYGSWGYQSTGLFAPTARYGLPTEFMAFVDRLHQRGVGVILDWVPSHFPTDEFALARFDGSHLYEHSDPREGFHQDWGSLIFNYGRHEVRSFLISSAMAWIERYHIDGLRVDAVASMLYRDYSRQEGEWVPNQYGGRENLEAVTFLQQLNSTVGQDHPDVLTLAEESTAWPGVTRPVHDGGLGFDYKWDMGWMHDTLAYFEQDPVHRRFHHGQITFRAVYAFSENYLLPLSHDEVVHGKGSILAKMPGDEWQQFANLRLLYGYQWLTPGKKLLFMGSEFGQGPEWDHDDQIRWDQRELPAHAGVEALVRDLNGLYATEPALHRRDLDPEGFSWVIVDDSENSVLAFLRRGVEGDRPALAMLNATPVPRHGYRVGVPSAGGWKVLLDTDDPRYGGSGFRQQDTAETVEHSSHGHEQSLEVDLPPLAMVVLTPETR